MAYSYPEIKKFSGLFLQANSFVVPDGALEQAENAVLLKDYVLTKMRGDYKYLSPATGKVFNSLHNYQGSLFVCSADSFAKLTDTGTAPNKTGTASALSGETVALTSPLVSRSSEASNNLYFTTDNGVLKIESTTSKIYKAGTPPALDLTGYFLPANGGVSGDAQTAWRVCFCRRDANSNLLLGAPGDICALTNVKVSAATWARVSNVVTVTTSSAHNLASSMTVSISGSTGTDPITAGDYVITVTAPTTFTFTQADSDDTGDVDYTTTRTARLEFSIPAEISDIADAYFYQIYRTSPSNSGTALPDLDFKLVDEQPITAAQIAAGAIIFDDDVADLFLSTELYTNPNSREGEAQANNRPPLCKDVTLFKNHLLYANIVTRQSIEIDLVSSAASVIATTDYIEIKEASSTARRYLARSGVGNSVVSATAAGTGTITITYATHGLSNGDYVYCQNITGTLTAGLYQISNVAAGTFDITAAGLTASALEVQGVKDTNGYYIFKLTSPAGGSVSVGLRETSQALVKAINRDVSSKVYARYISTPNGIPGQMYIEAKGFTGTVSFRANSATSGSAFWPVLPASFSTGVQVTTTNDTLQNTILSAKVGEPEAAPYLNTFPVGARNKKILRIVSLRDSVIILKEDGVFRLDGDAVSNFTSTLVDKTAICIAESSVDVLNNQAIFLSNQGVCMASPNAVQIVSRNIEDPIRAVLGESNISTQTAGVAYESSRLYFLTTIAPNTTSASVTYVYNVISNGWTTTTQLIKNAVIGPSDTMYFINTVGNLERERKLQSRIDYCGQNYSVTVVSVTSTMLSATITTAGTPEIGDVLVKNDVFSRIASATASGGNWIVTFNAATNIVGSDTINLYKKIQTTIKLAPFHAGAVGRTKQFAQMQLHLRDNSVSSMLITFSGPVFGGSPSILWTSSPVFGGGGFGYQPWGFFPWGQADGINLDFETKPAPVIRIYVPMFQQRVTYIQPVLVHDNAGEAINLQALTFAVRGYGERVSK
jgi:hypothetical protein